MFLKGILVSKGFFLVYFMELEFLVRFFGYVLFVFYLEKRNLKGEKKRVRDIVK